MREIYCNFAVGYFISGSAHKHHDFTPIIAYNNTMVVFFQKGANLIYAVETTHKFL